MSQKMKFAVVLFTTTVAAVVGQDVEIAPVEKLTIRSRQTKLYAGVSPKLRIEVGSFFFWVVVTHFRCRGRDFVVMGRICI